MIRIGCLMNKSTKFYAEFYLYVDSQFQRPPCSITTESMVEALCGENILTREIACVKSYAINIICNIFFSAISGKLCPCEMVYKLEDLERPFMAANGVPESKSRIFRFICL